MLTAHLPSGYLLVHSVGVRSGAPFYAALFGSVFPDFDMLFFHFIDNHSIHHHYYWVHIPAFWAAIAIVALPLSRLFGWFKEAVLFFVAITLHLILDTLAGGILWGAPFSHDLFSFVVVPATQSHWVLSFVLHWTFALELLIWIAAIWVFLRYSRPERA